MDERPMRGCAGRTWAVLRSAWPTGLVAGVVAIGGLLLPAPFADAGERKAVAANGKFEVGYLRTARSRTFAKSDGSMETELFAEPLHYRDRRGDWRQIDSRFVDSKRGGYRWESGDAGFSALLKGSLGRGAVRFEAAGAGFELTPVGASPSGSSRSSGNEVGYAGAYRDTDLQYALLPTGLKETLVLRSASAPSSYVFRLDPTAARELELVQRPGGAVDVRAPGAALPVAVIGAPVVSESKRVVIDDAAGRREELVETAPTPGKATMSLRREPGGSYELTLSIDQRWLQDPARVFPVRLDPTVTTAVDVQDGFWNMDCGACLPDTTSAPLYVATDGSGAYANATTRFVSGVVFSLGDIPSGASVTSTELDLYQTGCLPSTCQYWYPEWGIGQSGDVEVRRFSTPWGPATPSSGVGVDPAVLASRYLSMWWGGDQPGAWRAWAGAGLTSFVQGVVNGSTANYGLQLSLATQYYGWGPIFAGSRSADPSLAPKLVVQWVADGVQLNPATNVHSDGPELTWTRFAAGYGPYTSAILADGPRAYWRMDDGAGSPFGVADWSGNSLHAAPVGLAYAQPGATADGDTSIYFSGSSARMEASEAQIKDTFTIEAWVKRGATGARHTIFSRAESNGGGFRLLFNAGNFLELSQGDFAGPVATSTVTVTDSQWHHVAATKSGTDVRLYVDGVDVTGPVNNYTMTAGVGVVVVGAMRWYDYAGGTGINYSEPFNGWIDEPAVFPTALSPARIQAHYAAASLAGSGFVRFELHRSRTAGFTPSAGTLIATIKDPALQYYRDTSARDATTFYYKVVTVGTGGSASSRELAVATPPAGNATITVQPGVSLLGAEATTIASDSPCANNGGAGGITASASQRPLLRFDLRQIPAGSTVTGAELSLWTFQDGRGQTIELRRLTADWTEGAGAGACDASGASWTDRQPNVPWAAAGAEYDPAVVATFTSAGATPHWERATVTGLVGGWVTAQKTNFGLLLKHASEPGAIPITWTSDEYSGSAALRPKLAVTYADGSRPKAPQVAIGSPGSLTRLRGAVLVSAGAFDDGRVVSVQMKLDGADLGGALTSPPYELSWDTTSASRGPHALTAVATDDAGNTTVSDAVAVTVANSAPPSTSITAASSGTGTNPYRQTVVADGAAAYWRFGEASGTSVSSEVNAAAIGPGSHAGGVLVNQPGALAGDANGAVGYDGVDDTTSLTASTTVDLSAAGSVELWVKRVAGGVQQALVGKPAHPTASMENYAIWIDAQNRVRAEFGGGASSIALTAPAAIDTAWHHVVATFDAGTARLYVDGALAASGTAPFAQAAANAWHLLAGKANTGGHQFGGLIDELAVYPAALSASQVQTHYSQGTTAPAGGSTWQVSATADDDVAVSRVEFYVDGDRFATDTTSPYEASLDTLSFPVYDGQHVLSTRAYDADGNVTSSAGYAITVANTAGTAYRATISTAPADAQTAIPVGAVLPYVGSTGSIPSGWALADGAAVSRATYSDLFAAVGTAYGAGNGTTTFNLPDLRGRLPLGQSAAGTGSVRGASGGALDATGTAVVGAVPYAFSFTDTAASPAFAPGTWSWYGAGVRAASDYPWIGQSQSLNAVQLAATQAGTVAARGVTASGSANVAAAYGPAANPPHSVVRYLVKVDAAAAAPACALWGNAATALPAGALAADGQTASGGLPGCLDAAFAGNLPDLRGRFALGQAAAGTASALGGAGGALDQTAPVSLEVASTAASVTTAPASWGLDLTISAPPPAAPSTSTLAVENQARPLASILTVAGAGAGSIDGAVVAASAAFAPGSLTTTAAPAQTVTSAVFQAPYLALPFVAYTAASGVPAPAAVMPYAGTGTPAGWLKADGACVSTAAYPVLYDAIGFTYGGSGSSFCLPDLRGRAPLGQAATGSGSTLGVAGGVLDAQPSASFVPWSPQITVPSHSWTWPVPASTYPLQVTGESPGGCDTTCWQGNANVAIVTGALWAVYPSAAAGAQAVASTSAAQTVTGAAAGGQAFALPAQNPPYQTFTYLIATGSTQGPAVIPSEVRYDAAAGTQEQNRTTVTVTNTSSLSWSPATVFLRYRWIAPDGTVTSSANVSLGSALAAGASRAVTVDYDPPVLPAGVLRSLYTLRFDLVDTSSGSVYFASRGNEPLERSVLVTRTTPLELGLERYQSYESLDLGGGLTASVNLASGNLVVSGTLLDNPGRGLPTLVDLAYNSQEPGSFAPGGNGVSLGAGLARLGQPLDVHPNQSDAALERSEKWVGFADRDGSYHRFVGRSLAGGGTVYDEPTGVHLYLRATGSADPARYWALTRPDRATFYYDAAGWPTRVEDADGNALVSTLATVPAGEDAYGLAKRVTAITDAAGRNVAFAYYAKAETPTPALRGKLRSLTDHSGRLTRFDYYEDGNLMRITQAGGVGDDGRFSPERSLVFTYTNSAGSGPAIATLAARRDPPAATAQGRLLYSVIDYRGNESSFSYATSGAAAGRLSAWSDRVGATTSFSYDLAAGTAAVARPLSRGASFAFDAAGRVTAITDALGLTTAVSWTAGNAVSSIANTTTGRSRAYTYDANGSLTSSTDELGNRTELSYETLPADTNDLAASWPAGRSVAHLSQLASVTWPVGVATTADPADYRWSFSYTASGRLARVTDPLGNVTTSTYNADGTLAATTLPATGDQITRTTSYESYDGNGLPTSVRDAAGNRTRTAYGADGRLLWAQDALHAADAGPDTRSYRSVLDYDAYGRQVRSSSPKSTAWARGLLVWSETGYDANDNVLEQVAPYYAAGGGGRYGSLSASAYDAMDRRVSLRGPDTSSGGPEETRTSYDQAGRPARVTLPRGAQTAAPDDFTTILAYDALDRPLSETRYELDAAGAIDPARTRTRIACYDAAGDLRSLTAPEGAAGFSCPSPIVWPYTPSAQAYTTGFGYDAAHRQTSVTDPLGRLTRTDYDANGQPTALTDAAGKVWSTVYDARGEVVRTVSPFAAGRTLTTVRELDALGNLRRLISPRAFDQAGGTAPFADYVASFDYDALGRLVRSALPRAPGEAQLYVHRSFDALGRLAWTSLQTAAAEQAQVAAADRTVSDYWDTGWVYSTSIAGAPRVRFDYTAEGWQAARLPERAEQTGEADYGRLMLWEYYPDGLLAAERDLAGRRASFSWDADGNPTSASEAQGMAGETLSVRSVFDGFDALASTRSSKAGGTNEWVSAWSYDRNGNVSALEQNREQTSGGATVAPGRLFSFAYDAADQPALQTDDFGSAGVVTDDERVRFAFDGFGRLGSRTLERRTGASSWLLEQSQARAYFANGLLESLETRGAAGQLLASHTLSYLAGGRFEDANRTQDSFRLLGPDAAAPCRTAACTASFAYDGPGRLVQAADGTGTTAAFSLDAAGNVTAERRNGALYRSASYAGQRLLAETSAGETRRLLYDGQGNLDCLVAASWAASSCPAAASGQPVAPELLADYVYDYRDRLVAVRSYANGLAGDASETRYDPLGRPLATIATAAGATTSTSLVYLGLSDAVVRETQTGAVSASRAYAFDALGSRATLAETVAGATARYSFVEDPHGSTELLLDQANSVRAAYGYTAYGGENPLLTRSAAGLDANANPYRYSGKRLDAASGLYDMGARHYRPGSGRFLQPDRYAAAAADLGLSLDPLAANRYALAAGNPVNYIEADGHRVVEDAGLGGLRLGPLPEPVRWPSAVKPDAGIGCCAPLTGPGQLPAGGAAGRAAPAPARAPGRGGPAEGSANARTALSGDVAATFKGGQYTAQKLNEDIVLRRVYGGTSPELGPYWSRTSYSTPGKARQYLALPPGNTAERVVTIRVPAGTTIYEGRAAAHYGRIGGGNQVYIPRVDPAWITSRP